MQRLRVNFSRGEEVKYLSHLDLMRFWERVIRRADLPVAYSEGFSPHARISLAAPLPVGVTSQAEIMDIFLSRWLAPLTFTNQLVKQLVPGITVSDVFAAGMNEPSLQARVRAAEYLVALQSDRNARDIESAVNTIIAAEDIPWQHMRDTGVRHYNLRTLIDEIWIEGFSDSVYTMGMRLSCSSEKGSGRPEQVAKALGFTNYPESIHRTALILN
jgi:radical SAM-linked protein